MSAVSSILKGISVDVAQRKSSSHFILRCIHPTTALKISVHLTLLLHLYRTNLQTNNLSNQINHFYAPTTPNRNLEGNQIKWSHGSDSPTLRQELVAITEAAALGTFTLASSSCSALCSCVFQLHLKLCSKYLIF